MKALRINVYRNASYGDCSNGGITSRYTTLLLICEDGYIEVDEDNPPENLVQLVVRRFGGKTYKHIEPVAPCDLGCVGWMNGGAVAGSHDSRFSEMSTYPLYVHDRQETQEQYDRNFD